MMTFDDDFWPIAIHARGRLPNPKAPARKAWDRAVKNGHAPEQIVAGYKGYLGAMMDTDTDCQYICQAATFINQERWEQYLGEPEAKAFLARNR
jgi:hypothetical protein